MNEAHEGGKHHLKSWGPRLQKKGEITKQCHSLSLLRI